ncbi:sulfite exporter TauE/SafE family protein [Rubritalea spongiae]|uniref:Probable membrane transporter protein n=1 Tax=Rubritalea spongiae TaxID=430797 RepID=A0ABW5E217_9BACT
MTSEQIIVLCISAFCIGVAKAGFSGTSLIGVFLMTETFGAKEQIGIALPMLIMADMIVYPAFRKYGSWKPVWLLLWPALVGIGLALWVLNTVSNESMRSAIGWIILSMVGMQLVRKWKPELTSKLAHSKGFGVAAGVTGGVATMLANAAGPIMQLYLLSRNMSKMDLIGVGARFFLLVNLIKLPLSAGLSLTTWDTLKWNFAVLPVIVIAVWIGKKLLVKLPQAVFEAMIIVTATVAGVRLLG